MSKEDKAQEDDAYPDMSRDASKGEEELREIAAPFTNICIGCARESRGQAAFQLPVILAAKSRLKAGPHYCRC